MTGNNLGGEIAFGLSRHLERFRRIVPRAQNYRDLDLSPHSPDFAAELLTLMIDANRIHFNLTGMRELNTPDGVLSGPIHLNNPGSTNWELRTIWDDPTLRAKTDFYRDGKQVDELEVTHLP